MSNLLITNGLVIGARGQEIQDILIRDELIVTISPQINPPENCRIIDANAKWIFPGVIDPHTHMGIPIKSGYSADTFASGSPSALHGGVTTILDFSVLESGQTLRESLNTRIKLAGESLCDVGIHVNITRFEPEILAEIPDLIRSGYNSFKVFTTYAEADMMLTYDQIEAVATIIGQHNGILMVHSEDNDVIRRASESFAGGTQTHPRYHGLSRPAEAELVAINRLGEISSRTNCTIYIVHLNTAAGLAKATEYPLLKVETCPHYLLLSEKMYERPDGQMFVSSPPLRSIADSEALWLGLQNGQIHTIGSDHCPFCLGDKPAGTPYQDIPNGMGGVETLFPTLLAQFMERHLNLELLVRLTSSNPAAIFGLDHFKGSLKAGFHADLMIVDPWSISTNWESTLHTSLDWNAYTNFSAVFPETVIRRGEVVIDKAIMNSPSKGLLLKAGS
ncbi:MAG: amidohydrolase family protein [Candidatus Marinimicrobia bacterium]|nr:amidohydrolase family protein [Candidatus Neomarinimicrobiota bacterium]